MLEMWKFHIRSQKIWDKIEQGIAADLFVYNEILKIDIMNTKLHFPSSHKISLKEEPPPVYTAASKNKRAVRRRYMSL